MRLAQIARKVGMTPTDVKRFLESEFELRIGKELNYKLEDEHVKAVLEKFPVEEIEASQTTPPAHAERQTQPLMEEEDTAVMEMEPDEAENIEEVTEEIPVEELNPETLVAEMEAEVKTAEIEVTAEEVANKTDNSSPVFEINYDEPEVENPADNGKFEAVEVDPNAALIKAQTVKLDGLKILGKIELPETKIAEPVLTQEEIEAQEAEEIAALDAAMQSQVQDVKTEMASAKPKTTSKPVEVDDDSDSEFKDENGIYHFSPQQRANRAKALIAIELKNKAEFEKEKKRRHYEELMHSRKTPKKAVEAPKQEMIKKVRKEKPNSASKNAPPKGLWAKFLHWLND